MAKQTDSPATTSPAYDHMLPFWAKIETLLAGTQAMRNAGIIYLPQHEEESHIAWRERCDRATLLNMVQITLDSWVGKPFSDPVEIGEDVPTQLRELLDNIDLQGNDINVVARQWFRDGLAKGYSHVLVEFPRRTDRADGLPRTLQDDRQEALRPYLVHIKPENLIFAHSELVGGREVLTHVRIREYVTVLDGWAVETVERIRVLTPGLVQVYEKRKQEKTNKEVWVLIEEYDYALSFIPLVTFYADRQGFMLAKPPLNDLADLNIAHWQSSSDQTAILTVTRFPLLAVSGALDDGKLVVGPNRWLHSPDPAGRFYYVEHTGRAINAGRQDLLDKEEKMAEYGAIFLKRRPGGASATARALDSAETSSSLQDMAIRFESALNEALAFMGAWINISYDDTGTLSLNTDFSLSEQDSHKLVQLQEARRNRDISRSRYLKELRRFGVLSADFNPTTNLEELEDEAFNLPTGESDVDLDPAGQE